jgi:hypothetical protein
MSDPKPGQPSRRPPETPQGDPPREPGPYPVDGPVEPDGGGADPDYLPGGNQQPEDLPKR